jgi:caffeic acid 3-O-methyltransferase
MAANSSISDHAQAVPEDDHHATPLRPKIVDEQDAAMYAAMRLTMTSPVPAALKAAIELGVFEILAKARGVGKSLTAKEIASQVVQPVSGLSVINHGCLERILRLLASENVVSESAVTVASGNSSSYSNRSTERCYALLPVGTYFVRSDEGGASLAPLLFLEQDRDFQKGWHYLSATVLDDSTEPFKRAHGESYFQYISHNPRFSELLKRGDGSPVTALHASCVANLPWLPGREMLGGCWRRYRILACPHHCQVPAHPRNQL